MARLEKGDSAPDFETQDEAGNAVRLADLRGRRVVLYFYPRDNTPGCTAQACGFRDSLASLQAKNAVVLGVSPDTAKSHQKFRAKYDLGFPLLVDSYHRIAEAYGVWVEKSMYGRRYMGILRSHFVIDEEGRIVEAVYDVKPKESSEKALEALKG